jgi:MFS family permease
VGESNLDLNLLTCRPFAAALISLILSFLGLFAVGFLMPFYFENLRAFSPQTSGFLLTPFALAIAASAPVSGSLADRLGSRWLASGGMAVACVGLFLLSLLDSGSAYFDIIWRLVVVGIGTGIFQTPNNRALMQAAPSSEQGEASGMLGTGRVVGQSLSVAVAGAVFAAFGGLEANQILQQASSLPPDQLASLQQHFVSGFHAALVTSAAITAIGIVTSYERR